MRKVLHGNLSNPKFWEIQTGFYEKNGSLKNTRKLKGNYLFSNNDNNSKQKAYKLKLENDRWQHAENNKRKLSEVPWGRRAQPWQGCGLDLYF